MSEEKIIIELNNVSKTFKLFDRPTTTLKERIVGFFTGLKKSQLKALNNISFSVKKGEFFGIIGHNGSGKSTLLSIISNSIEPDKGGTAKLNAKFLKLSLGMGFNNQLTARQNVRLNGSILGLRLKEIEKLIPNLFEFAGLEKFIDTPLKFYSKGMVSRLGFAIGVYAKAELILLDEFIGGVGDEDFKAKADKAFEEMVLKGRTIVFVSHSLSAVKKYCNRVLVLHKGEMIGIFEPVQAIDTYKKLVKAKNIKIER